MHVCCDHGPSPFTLSPGYSNARLWVRTGASPGIPASSNLDHWNLDQHLKVSSWEMLWVQRTEGEREKGRAGERLLWG